MSSQDAANLASLLNLVPVYVLALFRLLGLMLFAPLIGSGRIPRRVKVLLAAVITASFARSIEVPPQLPETGWELAIGIGSEMLFGLAMGTVLSLSFVAAQWAGQIIGQQLAFNLSEVFDPQFGGGGSVVGELYFMFTLVIFLAVDGHILMLQGFRESFVHLPLLSVAIDKPVLDLLVDLVQAAMNLGIRVAAPVVGTLLIAELGLGFVGKTMPQMNVMSAGLVLRSLIGILVLVFSVPLVERTMESDILDKLGHFESGYRGELAAPAGQEGGVGG